MRHALGAGAAAVRLSDGRDASIMPGQRRDGTRTRIIAGEHDVRQDRGGFRARVLALAATLMLAAAVAAQAAPDLAALTRQAEAGDAAAQHELAMLYWKSDELPRDKERAHRLLELAAGQGLARAQSALGFMYLGGVPGQRADPKTAVAWLERAVAQGDAEGQWILGYCYDTGTGVLRDHARARRLYELAAAQGHGNAMYQLGVLYAEGDGVNQDYAQARRWYAKAAALGQLDGQLELGILYARGLGGPRDAVRARELLEPVCDAGDDEACDWMQRLRGRR